MAENRVYGYARVSDKEQNLDRQIKAFNEYGISLRNIYQDKASGKDFNRKAYLTLVGTEQTDPTLREGDLLVILSIDRLGRNYTDIMNQWRYITQTLKADIKVLDMPLLDTRNKDNNLDNRFIADLVLQILSYVAEKERVNIKARQRQGIQSAKDKGKHLGRPKADYPDRWQEIYSQWKEQHITAATAMQALDLKRTTFYKLVFQFEQQNKSEKS
jgi:DNA invertase Pin-like site-specific DNA recombinase